MSEIVWEDPPRAKGNTNSAETKMFAEELRSHPKRWAIYPHPISANTARTTASTIKKGLWSGGPGFDALTRNGVLYVRFVGEDAS